MIGALARRVFGSANDRYIKSLQPLVDEINAAEPAVAALSDDDLRARTAVLKERLGQGETVDDILPDAFATVREAARRTLGQRHFDVQLMGGIVLHRGMIIVALPARGLRICTSCFRIGTKVEVRPLVRKSTLVLHFHAHPH